ncbi:hypothetical protein XENTR_v10019321 [Xenopus tropicalis]|nr:hypothetical protein XENTR_v10019321 [Xenopus tropicalis]
MKARNRLLDIRTVFSPGLVLVCAGACTAACYLLTAQGQVPRSQDSTEALVWGKIHSMPPAQTADIQLHAAGIINEYVQLKSLCNKHSILYILYILFCMFQSAGHQSHKPGQFNAGAMGAYIRVSLGGGRK